MINFYPISYEFDRMIFSVKNKYSTLSKIFGEDMSLLTSALKQQFSRDRQEYLLEVKEQPEELLKQLYQQAESMRGVSINTTNYDYGQVKSKINIIYAHRQHLVRDMRPIKEIIELYPALSIADLVSIKKCIFYDQRITTIHIGTPDHEMLSLIDAYPIIQIQIAKHILNYSIVIEYNTIITTNSQSETISILNGSYEIFNIEYPAKLRATLKVLNDLSLVAKRFLNEYKLNNHSMCNLYIFHQISLTLTYSHCLHYKCEIN
ncbi:unnamed protein product [Rotaria socialis]|uniref:Uncharacterized protein n=1 Tax=Rotaria socialis TaxID=392032 RepID=A0A821ITV7_9BILA|nr:unnamed protein product [Rotaria socialis]CAF4457326.1 unnamed protein product [Rotaria socialis]CAF4707242.1 unnamed protein product [Rotaria socialis]